MMTAAMMKEAVTGTARPRISTAIALKMAVNASESPAASTIRPESSRPSPVSETTATMMPAAAVVAAGAGHQRAPDLARAHPVAPVEERHQEREHRRVEHGAERRHAHRQQHGDRDQRREVVAPAQQQPPEAGRVDVDALHPEAPRVGL